jgi:purine nucleoside phosphorylase
VAGLSLISNLAAGIEDAALSHEEVTATAARVVDRSIELLHRFIPAAAEELSKSS